MVAAALAPKPEWEVGKVCTSVITVHFGRCQQFFLMFLARIGVEKSRLIQQFYSY